MKNGCPMRTFSRTGGLRVRRPSKWWRRDGITPQLFAELERGLASVYVHCTTRQRLREGYWWYDRDDGRTPVVFTSPFCGGGIFTVFYISEPNTIRRMAFDFQWEQLKNSEEEYIVKSLSLSDEVLQAAAVNYRQELVHLGFEEWLPEDHA